MNRNVTAVILIVLAIGVYVTYTKNVWTEVNGIQSINNTYVSALADAQAALDLQNSNNEKYNSITSTDQERLNKMLPTELDNIRLMINLNTLAKKMGLTLLDLKISSPVASAPTPTPQSSASTEVKHAVIDSIKISFNTSTSYDKFREFLKALEANLRVMDVTHLGVKATDNGIYDYSLELKTYWIKP